MLLSQGMRRDGYFRCYFRDGSRGDIARTLFFVDEIRMRRRHGLVVHSPEAVALVGLPPRAYVEACDLSPVTHLAISAQGVQWRQRWNDTLEASQVANATVSGMAYLSAIACMPQWRRRGVASALLIRVTDALTVRGVGLECEVGTVELRGWYERRGFNCVGTAVLPDGQNVWRMVWGGSPKSSGGVVVSSRTQPWLRSGPTPPPSE